MSDTSDTAIHRNLVFALERLATGFESADPHVRHEAKMVAKQNFRGIAVRITEASDGR